MRESHIVWSTGDREPRGTAKTSKGMLGRFSQSKNVGFTPRAPAPSVCALQGSLWLPSVGKESEEGDTLGVGAGLV